MPNLNILLREARESKELTIQEAAKALKLRERHIKMLEDGELAELSKEVYLKGFIKKYSNWLNIDSSNIPPQISNKQTKIKLHNLDDTSPVVSIGLSYIIGLIWRPGVSVFLLSIILTIGIYFFWSSNHKNIDNFDIISALNQGSEPSFKSEFSNILEYYNGKDLVLVSNSIVQLKIISKPTHEEKIITLSAGDVHFFKVDKETAISSDHPNLIDVFLDSENGQEQIGTLEDILIKF
jgi:transcriptional regulator with XRE-family HTH domain